MIFKRFAANLRGQNWTAIGIEFAIVVAGVFVGTQVSNWNDERRSAIETRHMLADLKPELGNAIRGADHAREYYAVTRGYADTAFAGWRGDKAVSDKDFVIAAYQASQTTWSATNSSNWASIFGSGRLRTIDDPALRGDLTGLMTIDVVEMERELNSPYRTNVRKVIPEDIQDAIRERCGDRRAPDGLGVILPKRCDLALPAAHFMLAAAALRARPDLIGDLRWHFAAVATYLENLQAVTAVTKRGHDRLGDYLGE